MEANFKTAEQKLVDFLVRNKVMTQENFNQRIRLEIAVLQGRTSLEQRDKELSEERDSQRLREHREIIADRTTPGRRAEFHRIEPGTFMMGSPTKSEEVTITEPFEMMSTPMTQMVWKSVAQLVNSKLAGRYKINMDPSFTKGETHPVESLTYEKIQTWIQGLNELSQNGEPGLQEFFPSHKTGDTYRLPTDMEWEYVIRGRGLFQDYYHFGTRPLLAKDYAWFKDNSGGTTQPVGLKLPVTFDHLEFYDMIGNVSEYVHGYYNSGTPQKPINSALRIVRGGDASSTWNHLVSSSQQPVTGNTSSYLFGFRLAKAVK